ncbi:hypothetical protein OG211_33865 [Streptomyces niveus]|nr:hypothetical protein [Streptomyces niveus]WTA63124.1 hypothetical protein OG211_33865 [Streptomyces niveus]
MLRLAHRRGAASGQGLVQHRAEVLLAESRVEPTVEAGCKVVASQ